ncbi:Ig-like domain-containing protein [Longimicrobium sp.]|uniref:Ig-like domain-containing protein n=1 Tax=Longimicrobium sp. TaxID=2029185 RepID=UPI002BF02930|nr:Ig-like domain-containing protein [Longimicrobium sp.]HSU15878.1 Ig-like domain-containing protein [Longimicrobium sp.]
MNLHRALSLALAAFVISAVASCAGDGGSPTSSGPNASPGSQTRPNSTQLVLASGGNQTGVAGQPLPNPVAVRVLDATSRPVSGATVNFIARDGSADPTQASTDADGYARTTWTLGTAAGTQELRVSGTGGTTLVVGATAVAPAKVARVQVIPDSLVLSQGATGGFSAVAYDSTGNALTGRAITWASSDSVVATVSSTGSVTAVSPGAATVTATVEGVGGTAKVIVSSPPRVRVARVKVEPDSLALQPGQTGDFNAVGYDSAGNVLTGRAVSWTISDSTVAHISGEGAVTALSAGTARATATVEGVSGTAKVIVSPPPPATVARVVVSPDSVVLQPGHTADLDAAAYDAEGHVLTGRAVTWTTSDSTIARVGADGMVTAVAAGTARATATVEGVGGTAKVIVVAPPPAAVARVAIVPDSLVLDVGGKGDFDAVAYDAEGHVLTGRAVAWTSSDSTVAVIGVGGAVTARSPGNARISATVEGVSGSAMVIVHTPVPAIVRVEVVPDSQVVVIGHTADFSAFAYDATNHIVSGLAVTWSISEPTVARIGQYGLVTALAAGTARVTATVEGVSGSATVRVIEQPVGSASAPTNTTPDLRAGYDYVCRLRSGIIQCYGDDDEGQPIGEHHAASGSFVQLTAGQTHACGLRSDGVVECFGSSQYGEAPAQKRAATGSFTQVSAGLNHSCAIRGDGAMECWGNDSHGEAPPLWTAQSGRFVVVTANANRTCALRNDGVGECRGFRLGDPSIRILPGGWYVMLGTSTGTSFCLQRNTGEEECWGDQQVNLGSGPFVDLTVGGNQVCVLRPDGHANCAGYAPSWQGPGERSVTGPDEGSVTPRTWARLTAGTYHTCGLRRDGYFECFGLQTIGSDAPDVVPWADTPTSAPSGGSVRVSWRDINSNELRTEIDRSVADADGNPTTWARAGVLGANTTGFTDGQATPGAIYVYRIRVCNNAGCSGWAQSNATRYPAA